MPAAGGASRGGSCRGRPAVHTVLPAPFEAIDAALAQDDAASGARGRLDIVATAMPAPLSKLAVGAALPRQCAHPPR